MKITIIAVGQKVPDWAQIAWQDYIKRFVPEIKVELKAIKTEPRAGGKTPEQLMSAEAARINAAIPRGAYIIALHERGQAFTTKALADELLKWQQNAQEVVLLIGGPDGLAPELLSKSNMKMRISDLTLPHAMVRVLLIEQLYRAWSINAGHPYHRE